MAPNVEILLKMKDEASKQLEGFNKQLGMTSQQAKIAGAAITGFGVAIAGMLGMSVKAYAEEEAGIARLSVAMRNVGLDYEANKAAIEGNIDAMQQLTSFADSEQRDALASLVRITRDYTKAEDLLSLAMDVAVGTGRDLAGANTLIMYALSGNWGMLERYIPALKEAQTEEAKWAMLRELFAGQAEAYGNTLEGQLKTLKNNLGDLMETVGEAIAPVVKWLGEIINKVVMFAKEHPELVKMAAIFAAVAAAISLIVGPALLIIGFLPSIAAGFALIGGVSLAALGPIGLIIAAIIGIASLGYLIISNWKEITAFFGGLWAKVVEIFKAHWDKILMAIFPLLAIPILIIKNWDSIISFFKELPERIKGFFANLVSYIKAPFIEAINWIVDKINWLIEQFNKISPFNVGMIGRLGEPKIPTADTGGVFRGPGAVRIGNISEMMIPMGKGAPVSSPTFNITINTDVMEGNEQSARRWARTMMDYMREDLRRVGATL